MSFSETIFLFFLALIVFGPKKLPEIARQAGKLLAELRRASNEFRSQIEQEIAHIEVENNKSILPPLAAPEGSVAATTLEEAPAMDPPADAATLAAPAAEPEKPAVPATEAANPATIAEDSASPVASSQESHA